MGEDNTEERLRGLVAALWRPDLSDGRRPVLTGAQCHLAVECAAWVVGQQDPPFTEEVHRALPFTDDQTEAEKWKLTAYAMEIARNRAVRQRDRLTDVASAAAVLLCCVEEDGTHTREAAILAEALKGYSEVE